MKAVTIISARMDLPRLLGKELETSREKGN